MTVYKRFFKRFADTVLAFFGAILLLPVFLIVAVAVFIDDPGPVFFTQLRVGKNKKLFRLHKFRSMKTKTPDVPTHLLEDPNRYITRVGRFLRRTSLDELPQIYDILFGKMSVVGPRPALWNQDDLIEERDKYGANAIKPGLTGWAQVNGRDVLDIRTKAKFDGEYVQKMSFAFDCKCFFRTFGSVLRSDGVVEGAAESSEKEDKNEKDTDNRS